jgi:hypothetical protein
MFRPGGDDYPGFDTRISNRKNRRTFYLNIGCQADKGQAGYNLRHIYFSLRKSLLSKMPQGFDYGIIMIPLEPVHHTLRYHKQLAEAARLSESHPKLGYLCTNDEARLLQYCSDLADFLGARKNIL